MIILNCTGNISLGDETPEIRLVPIEANAELPDLREIPNAEETLWPSDDSLNSNFQQHLETSTIHGEPQQDWGEIVIGNPAADQYCNEGFLRAAVLMFQERPPLSH